MKKTLLFATAILMALPALARDFEYTYEGQTITYTVIDEAARTCKTQEGKFLGEAYYTVSGAVILPANPKDGNTEYTLTQIGASSFGGSKELTSISLPSTIDSIGQYAFCNCTKLVSINIPTNVTYLGAAAFSQCKSLPSIEIPDGITQLLHSTFGNCWFLTSVKMGRALKEIGPSAFYGCRSLTEIRLGESVETIGNGVFRDCEELTSIYLPASVKNIGSAPFENTGLKKVEIESLETFCNIEFYESSSNPLSVAGQLYINGELINDLVIPNTITSISNNAFAGWRGLYSVKLSNSLTKIGDYAFSNTNISEIKFPQSLTTIGSGAFSGCRGLKELVIPNSVTTIGSSAFNNCTGLTSIILGTGLTSIGNSAFQNCENFSEIVIPNSVTRIEWYAFQNCYALRSIYIGYGVSQIFSGAFANSTPSNIYITTLEPPAGSEDVFSDKSGNLYTLPQSGYGPWNYIFPWGQFQKRYDLVEATAVQLFSSTDISGSEGDTHQIVAWVYPTNATIDKLLYRTTNPDVATVDHNGLVTIHGGIGQMTTNASGEATTASCKIIVESLYSNCPIAQVNVTADLAGLEDIVTDSNESIDYSAPYDVYNLQGVRVGSSASDLTPGLYIVRQGTRSAKIVR